MTFDSIAHYRRNGWKIMNDLEEAFVTITKHERHIQGRKGFSVNYVPFYLYGHVPGSEAQLFDAIIREELKDTIFHNRKNNVHEGELERPIRWITMLWYSSMPPVGDKEDITWILMDLIRCFRDNALRAAHESTAGRIKLKRAWIACPHLVFDDDFIPDDCYFPFLKTLFAFVELVGWKNIAYQDRRAIVSNVWLEVKPAQNKGHLTYKL